MEGDELGRELGPPLGDLEGDLEGDSEGDPLGFPLGDEVGIELGASLGVRLGITLGIRLGAELAEIDGDAVGLELGFDVGVVVGVAVGESVFLHFLLHVAGQKNLTFFLPEPGWIFLHLFLGFSATYESHVRFALPSNRNESKFSHRPRVTVGEDVGESVFLHFLLHADGQKNFSFFPLDSGCIFSHLSTGLIATYKSHVLDELPSNLKSRSFEQSMGGTALGAEVTSSRGFLHSVSHVPGQNFLTVFPPDSGCIFSHLLTGLIATYKSHVLDELPSNLKSRSFEQFFLRFFLRFFKARAAKKSLLKRVDSVPSWRF